MMVWLLLYTHKHRSIVGAADLIILTPANQLMVMGLKIWSLSNPDSNQLPFDHWPTSLPTALTGPKVMLRVAAAGGIDVMYKRMA
jgi:hypothetical protein